MLNARDSGSDMELLNIKCELAALDVELKLCRLGYLLRKFSADQPRVPAGSPEGGQWTSGGAGGGGEGDSAEAGDDPEGGHASAPEFLAEGRSANSNDEEPPKIPEQEPATAKERYAFLKLIARSADNIATTLAAPGWFQQRFLDWVVALNESPRSLEEL